MAQGTTLIISNLTADQKRWLRSSAKREGITMAAFVKNWINEHIAKVENGWGEHCITALEMEHLTNAELDIINRIGRSEFERKYGTYLEIREKRTRVD